MTKADYDKYVAMLAKFDTTGQFKAIFDSVVQEDNIRVIRTQTKKTITKIF